MRAGFGNGNDVAAPSGTATEIIKWGLEFVSFLAIFVREVDGYGDFFFIANDF